MREIKRTLHGRTEIRTSVAEISSSNVVDILEKVLNTHAQNRNEIDYLWKYYHGEQPILGRVKEVRPEICNKVVVNIANEIVTFTNGYQYGEPIQYISRNGEEKIIKNINKLNEIMFAEDKSAQDQEIGEWQAVCGTAFRLVLPDNKGEEDDAPFEMYTLDPRNTFVVYSNEIGNKAMMGVHYVKDENDEDVYSVYTDTMFFEIKNSQIIEAKAHMLGCVPIFEYPMNKSRMGAFEPVLPLLDAINTLESNRVDGVEQFVQAFIKFVNCDIDEEEYKKFIELGAIKIKSVEGQKADVEMVTSELKQTEVQILKDDLYNTVLTICGMPNRNGKASTSDTGSAVLLRDGWSDAEARAKNTEHMFKKSEKKMLKLVLALCRESADINLSLKDIQLKFTRRNYENIQSKAQVLCQMLSQDKLHPQLAFESSGMFIDPESAYTLSAKYTEEQEAKASKLLKESKQNQQVVVEDKKLTNE